MCGVVSLAAAALLCYGLGCVLGATFILLYDMMLKLAYGASVVCGWVQRNFGSGNP